MSGSITNAVAQRDDQPAGNQVIEQYRNVFAEVLPSHIKPATWVRVAQGALRRNPDLARAAAGNPQSLVSALLDAARRGLEPGTEQYYLVPYGSEVQGIVGYQGEIELIYRAGAVSSVICEVVYEKDRFEYQPGLHDRPHHEIDWDAEDRGKLRLVYAYAVMRDGATSRVVVMNRAEVMTHKAEAKGTGRADSPWNKWEKSMWLKTAAHELAKWVPTSAEYLRDQARAAGEMIRTANRPTSPAPVHHGTQPAPQREPQGPQAVRADVIPGEVVDTDVPAREEVIASVGTGRPATDPQKRAVNAIAPKIGLSDRDLLHHYLTEAVGRTVNSVNDLTNREASTAIDLMQAAEKAQQTIGGGS